MSSELQRSLLIAPVSGLTVIPPDDADAPVALDECFLDLSAIIDPLLAKLVVNSSLVIIS